MAANSVSAHYLITQSGELLQFVSDSRRAYHAGIDSNTRKLYRSGYNEWSRYLKYFDWFKNYPIDAVYVDGDGLPVWDKSEAQFVLRHDGEVWPNFFFFRQRWKGREIPHHFDIDPDPNNYSIGIECLSEGSEKKDPKVYSDEMYETLRLLLGNLSRKYNIPIVKGRVIGHEDVNPIWRFGWDPNQGFDWESIYR